MKSIDFKTVRCALALAVGVFFLGCAIAQTKMYGTETGIYCSSDGAGTKGIACDVMAEVANRVGNTGSINLLPLARAAAVLLPTDKFFVTPVAPDGKIEKVYDLFAKIVEDQYVLVGVKESKADLSTLEAAKDTTIGVLRGIPVINVAKAKGLTKFEENSLQEQSAKMLLAGRIDAWLSTWNGALEATKAAGGDPGRLRRGVVLAPVALYLAASPAVDKAEVAKWKAAFESMKNDGSLAKILKKYDWQ